MLDVRQDLLKTFSCIMVTFALTSGSPRDALANKMSPLPGNAARLGPLPDNPNLPQKVCPTEVIQTRITKEMFISFGVFCSGQKALSKQALPNLSLWRSSSLELENKADFFYSLTCHILFSHLGSEIFSLRAARLFMS